MSRAALSVHMPFPVSVNAMFSHGTIRGVTRRFPSRAYKAWRKAADWTVRLQRPRRFDGRVKVEIQLYPGSARRRDTDNFIKPCLDCLVRAGVLRDDSQVEDVRAVMGDVAAQPHAIVRIEPIGQTDLEDIIRERVCA